MDVLPVVLIVIAVVLVLLTAVIVAGRRRRLDEPSPGAIEHRGSRIGRSAAALGASLRLAWGGGVGEETWAGLEEALLGADVGFETTESVVAGVRASDPKTPDEARRALGQQLRAHLGDKDRRLRLDGHPSVVLVVGVNGTGKTTTIAKLAARLAAEGKRVILAAGDTFRAAAAAQLETWADRLGLEVVSGQEGADPASVAFDAIASARAKGIEVVIVDTAGRLHAKKNLMAELGKIHRVAAGERGEVDEVLLVLDATGGQNGLTQVREFTAAVPVSGVVLTKLDGTAKGGIVIAVERHLGTAIKFVGLGEGINDLVPFDPDEFVADLLEQS